MATTTNLLATKIEASQSQKEVTANAAFDIFDKAIAGNLSRAITTADVTLTDDEARNAIITLTGALTGNRNLIVPARTKIYVVFNNTTGAFTITVKTAAGTGVAVPQGARTILYCDGTNIASIAGSSTLTDFKESVRAATTANITLSGAQTIDGVSVVANDRVLVKDQTTGSANGIYVAASGAWARATDFDADAEVTGGGVVPVSEGTLNGNQLFILTTNDPIVVGTTALSFSILQVQTIGVKDFKAAVRVATTGNGTLATAYENGDTVEGVTLATGDRILIKDQTTGSENGVYTVNASGAPTRATDFDADAEAIPGVVIPVTAGTLNGGTLWMLTTNGPITLDTTALIFSKLGSGGVASGDSTFKATFGSRPATANDGNLFFPTDGYSVERDTGAVWEPWGPIFPLTKPPAVASFTWVNQGAATGTDSGDGIVIIAPTNSGDNLRILKKAAPSTPYTITVGFLACFVGQSFFRVGACWRQSSDGKLATADLGPSSSEVRMSVTKWNGVTSFNADYVTFVWPVYTSIMWIRISDDGTNRKVFASSDGRNFIEVHSVGRTDFLTADEVGIFVNVNNASFQAIGTFLSWLEA